MGWTARKPGGRWIQYGEQPYTRNRREIYQDHVVGSVSDMKNMFAPIYFSWTSNKKDSDSSERDCFLLPATQCISRTPVSVSSYAGRRNDQVGVVSARVRFTISYLVPLQVRTVLLHNPSQPTEFGFTPSNPSPCGNFQSVQVKRLYAQEISSLPVVVARQGPFKTLTTPSGGLIPFCPSGEWIDGDMNFEAALAVYDFSDDFIGDLVGTDVKRDPDSDHDMPEAVIASVDSKGKAAEPSTKKRRYDSAFMEDEHMHVSSWSGCRKVFDYKVPLNQVMRYSTPNSEDRAVAGGHYEWLIIVKFRKPFANPDVAQDKVGVIEDGFFLCGTVRQD